MAPHLAGRKRQQRYFRCHSGSMLRCYPPRHGNHPSARQVHKGHRDRLTSSDWLRRARAASHAGAISIENATAISTESEGVLK